MNADALLADILANPDDDTPRLVFADWLEEHGDTDRATFIRIQIRQAQVGGSLQLVPGYVECNALASQAQELLRRHTDDWMANLPRALRSGKVVFHRGFVEELALPVNQMLKVSARVWANHPIRELHPKEVSGKLDQVLALPQLAHIRKLALHSRLSEQDLAALATTDSLSHLRDLTIMSGGNQVAEALACCPSLRGLTRLFLSGSNLDAGALATLTASANVTNLMDLRLDFLRMGGIERARVLARSPGLAALTRLSLVWIGDEGVAALADSPHLAGLRSLNLARTQLSPAGIQALAATRHLTRLQILDLRNNSFGTAGVRALGGAVWNELAQLGLSTCELGDEGVATLAECPSWPSLISLTLEGNTITAKGVRALARSPHLQNLVWLSLYNNKIGDEGALALCESQTLGKLQRLSLSYCGPFAPAVEASLRQRFGNALYL